MELLIQKLNSIPNSYYEFVDSVVGYVKTKESRLALVTDYINNNESATPSDIIRFISFQPDFFEDSVPEDIESLVG